MSFRSSLFVIVLVAIFSLGLSLVLSQRAEAQINAPSAMIIAGAYDKAHGPTPQCRSFELAADDVKTGDLVFSGFSMRSIIDCTNGRLDAEGCHLEKASEFDPSCVFHEISNRQDFSDHTVLIQRSKEICGGVVRHDTLITLRATRDEWHLDLRDPRNPKDEPLICHWVRRSNP